MAVREPRLRPRGRRGNNAPQQGDGLPAGVLWDMDGTPRRHRALLDRGGAWSSWQRTVAEWDDTLAHQLVGNALEVSAQVIIDHTGIPLTVPQVIDALLLRVIEQVRGSVPWRPGAREPAQASLNQHGVPNVLVTMSWRNLASTIVGACCRARSRTS